MDFVIILCGIMAVFCIAYYIMAASYAGIKSSFLNFWLISAVCFVLIIIVLLMNKKDSFLLSIPLFIRVMFLCVICIGIIYFIIMELLIISKIKYVTTKNVEYVVILGAQIRGDRITKSLRMRLDAAYDYIKKNEECSVVCTGGQGKGENTTEAYAMKNYLVEKGVNQERIIMEDKSTSTYLNLKNTKEMVEFENPCIAVVTNNFHLYRGMYLAKKIGFNNVYGIAADCDKRLFINYMVREGIALGKEFIIR